jgi:succinate dehydrogenase / fumarate reductase iron-sulfur subunit
VSSTLKNLTLKVWRQAGPGSKGHFESHTIDEITDEASFLEMLDILNERLISQGNEAVVFDHDCREGICGTCSLMINGQAHGPERGTATCQLHMRKFSWSIARPSTALWKRVDSSPRRRVGRLTPT